MPNVSFEHPELKDARPQYELIADAVAGEHKVKSRKTKYLPQPNPSDLSEANRARYDAYRTRAVFYNVTRRTLAGLVGAVFETAPTENVPDDLKAIIADASGGGISLEQLAHKAVRLTLSQGRMGLFIDFPDTPDNPNGLPKAEADKLRPTITAYKPLDIVNWRVDEMDGVDVLTLVVLREDYIVSDDGFQQTKKEQYRVLRLVGGQYVAEIWRGNTKPFKTFNPTDYNGKPLDHIPFMFVGAENNDAEIDDPPMYDLASLNMAHYRNSADYEELVYIIGQPTAWFSGLTKDWVDDVFKGEVQLGSRAAIPLPVDGQAGILQVEPNTAAFEAMEHKEKQMVALGAKLVEQRNVQRTAREAVMDNKGETSQLATAARNVSTGLEWALAECRLFIAANTDSEIEYQLNTDYGLSDLTPEELNMIMKAWLDRGISFTEMRVSLRQAGIATLEDDKARTEIDTEIEVQSQREVDKLEATAKAQAKHKSNPAPAVGN